MNIQPGRMNSTRRPGSAKRNPNFLRQLGMVFKIVFFLVLIVAVLVVHIYMNQRITETEREIRSVRLNTQRISTEIVNLRNDYERFCSRSFVVRQMARFKLNLVPAEPGQIARMDILPSWQVRRMAVALEQEFSSRTVLANDNRRQSRHRRN